MKRIRSMTVLCAVLTVCATAAIRAQVPDTLDMPNPDDFKYGDELIQHYSHGWFPQMFAGHSLTLFTTTLFADVYDAATNLRSRSLKPTTSAFSWHDPFVSDERDIKKAFKDEDEDDAAPVTNYTEYGATFLLNLPMPAAIRLDGSLKIMEGLLFSSDTTRSYLGLNGIPHAFKEYGVLYLKEYNLVGSAGLEIPIYGVFLASEAADVSTYYYLHLGASASYTVNSYATQYLQIADAKDALRYGNGTDTLNLINDSKLIGLNRFRTGIDIGLGWRFSISAFVFNFQAFCNVPLSSVLDDADWKQFTGGLRFGIGYQWLPEH